MLRKYAYETDTNIIIRPPESTSTYQKFHSSNNNALRYQHVFMCGADTNDAVQPKNHIVITCRLGVVKWNKTAWD